MNAEAVKQEIQNIIANRFSKQHTPAKWQIAKAAELGLTEVLAEIDTEFGRGMKLGHSDYAAILDAATDSGKTGGGMTADLEWSESTAPASALYKLLNEVEPVEILEAVIAADDYDNDAFEFTVAYTAENEVDESLTASVRAEIVARIKAGRKYLAKGYRVWYGERFDLGNEVSHQFALQETPPKALATRVISAGYNATREMSRIAYLYKS